MRSICHCLDANGVIYFTSDGVICSRCASGVRDLGDSADDVLIVWDLCHWSLIDGVLSGWCDDTADGVRVVVVEFFNQLGGEDVIFVFPGVVGWRIAFPAHQILLFFHRPKRRLCRICSTSHSGSPSITSGGGSRKFGLC